MFVLLLYNPRSGTGNIGEQLDFIIKRFQAVGQYIVPYRMEDREALKHYMADLPKAIEKIIISGGDGTIHQVVNLMIQNDIDLPIALFPTGTANDFSQYFNIPKTIEGMIDVATKETYRLCDVGKANNQYFINVASFGNLVDISQRVNDQAKNVLGVLAYYIKGIEEIPKLKAFDVEIVENDVTHKHHVYFVLVMNGKSAGGFRKLAPISQIDDGLLDVVAFQKCPVLEIMPLLIKVLNGEHPNSEHIAYYQTSQMCIKCDELVGTDLDGEVGPDFPLNISVLKHRLKVICALDEDE